MDTGIEPTKESGKRNYDLHGSRDDSKRKQAEERNFDDIFIADIDAHHTETESGARSSLISMTPRPRTG